MDLSFHDGRKVPYSFEIRSYQGIETEETNIIKYETDLFICENISENKWKSRIIIEGKLNSVITYDSMLTVKNLVDFKSGNISFCSI